MTVRFAIEQLAHLKTDQTVCSPNFRLQQHRDPPTALAVEEVARELAIDRGAVLSRSDRDHPDRLPGLAQVENLLAFIEGEVIIARYRLDSPSRLEHVSHAFRASR